MLNYFIKRSVIYVDIKRQVDNILAAKQDKEYRNKVQFFFDYNNGRIVCGFFGRKSHDVINNDNCFLVNETINKLKNEIVSLVKMNKPGFFNTQRNALVLKSIIIRQSFYTKEIMLIFITSRKISKGFMDTFLMLVENLMDKIPELKSVHYSVNSNPGSFTVKDKIIHLKGAECIIEAIGRLRFKISPGSFFQVNPSQAYKLYNKIIELAGLKINETILDLFCGTGIIGLFLAGEGRKVFGIDIGKSSIEDARENAKMNKIKNAEFIKDDIFNLLKAHNNDNESLSGKIRNSKIDLAIIDPPRDGLGDKLVNLISKLAAKRIIYVSCNASTLSRDLKYFDILGYKTKTIIPIDMFPHTEHVECVVLMSRV